MISAEEKEKQDRDRAGRTGALRGKTVLFMGVGLAHYHNPLLNRLQRELGVRIVNIVSAKGPGHVLPGVYQTEQGIEFEVVRLPEYTPSVRYHTFRGLGRVIRMRKPAIIVCTDYYFATFLFNIPAILAAGMAGTSLIMKSIPYGVRTYDERMAELRARYPGLRMFFSPRALAGLAILAGCRVLYRRADAHVVYVDAGRDIYTSYGVPPAKIFTIYNSPDTDTLLEAAARVRSLPPILPPCPRRIIHVGRLVPEKRVDLLLRVARLLSERFTDLELLVVGDGPERSNLERLAQEIGLGDRARFVGAVHDPETLGRYFRASRVYVLAGRGGLAINDAMCFGKPVVCSVYEGVEKDLVEEGGNGYIFQPEDEADCAEKVGRILADDGLAARMGQRSEEIIRTRMNIHMLVGRYAAAFEYVLGSR